MSAGQRLALLPSLGIEFFFFSPVSVVFFFSPSLEGGLGASQTEAGGERGDSRPAPASTARDLQMNRLPEGILLSLLTLEVGSTDTLHSYHNMCAHVSVSARVCVLMGTWTLAGRQTEANSGPPKTGGHPFQQTLAEAERVGEMNQSGGGACGGARSSSRWLFFFATMADD